MLYSLERVTKYIKEEFRKKKEKVINNLEPSEQFTDPEKERAFFLNLTLPFTDQVKHL
jgi:hypothetical protein